MKKNIELDILRGMEKLKNLGTAVKQVNDKIGELEKELEKLGESAKKERERILLLGIKTERRDEISSTPSEIQKKKEFNQNLHQAKLKLLSEQFPEFYEKFEKLVPDSLKDSNISFN